MCTPMSMAVSSFVIGALGSVASGMSARAQAKAQNDYNVMQAENYKKTAELNNKASIQEYTEQSTAERIAQMQENERLANEKQEQHVEMLQKQGTMLASSNSAGVALDLLLGDYERQQAVNTQKLETQKQNTAVNTELALNSYKNKAQNRINSQQGYSYMQSDDSYNALGTALGIGTAGINAYTNYKGWEKKA